MQLTVKAMVKAPINRVWQAYTTPQDIILWNAASDDWHTTAATIDLREGGQFSSRMEAKDGSMGFDFAGTYTKIVPQSAIDYDFGDRKASVRFAQTDEGVYVLVNFDPENEFPQEVQQQGWQSILDNFAKYVEAQKD
jgi:uncharacterized protein YndB with AHSA1/START domain